VTPAEKKALRARWSEEIILRINEPIARSTPAKPPWTIDALAAVASGTNDARIDLRGFTFYQLRNVEWTGVDMSASVFKRGMVAPKLIATAALGSPSSRFVDCLFDEIDGGDANFAGRYERCSFARAKIPKMDFSDGYRAQDTSFEKADLSKAKMIGNVRFARCNFAGAKLKGANITHGAHFEDCNFDGASFEAAGILNARFVRCSMKNIATRAAMTSKNVFEEMEAPTFDSSFAE
jgi:uncharacterized protein YjbI with pentapeptide repeats